MTYNEAMTARTFQHKTLTNADGKTPMTCRRNGKTKTWKTRNGLMIPVKRGRYETGYIANFAGDKTLNNMDDWEAIA